ncbi:hypothetical protein ColLi_12153 [Colletotrichum liriopes]|uniref:Uncharacterized protein n=1 Tax=Colletotrichum liriopes TaxID=708192 RepID=A0AA37GXV4_9PEZI|nr:hypothetical protein ColLi_12153 [Colletotrichum liriopes]
MLSFQQQQKRRHPVLQLLDSLLHIDWFFSSAVVLVCDKSIWRFAIPYSIDVCLDAAADWGMGNSMSITDSKLVKCAEI